MEALNYTTTEINREFLIRMYLPSDVRKSYLVGVSTLVHHVGVNHANDMLERAFRIRNDDKCVYKLRRGVRIDFVNH